MQSKRVCKNCGHLIYWHRKNKSFDGCLRCSWNSRLCKNPKFITRMKVEMRGLK